MKKAALLLLANAVLWVSPAFAEDRAPAAQSADPPAAAVTPAPATSNQNVSTVSKLCSKSDPYIEYRDCVNASTRDANAKVRMG